MRAARALVAAVLLVLTVLGTAAPASAHARLVTTDPVDGSVVTVLPTQVTLTFNEPVRLVAGDDVRAVAEDGSPWSVRAQARDKQVVVTPAEDPGDGTLVVSWRVVAEDGHELDGTLTFTVARSATVAVDAPATTATATWTARVLAGVALVLLAVLAVVGAAGRVACWRVALGSAVLLAPLEQLREERRGLGGLGDWLAWLDGFTDRHSLLLLGAVVLGSALVPSRRPLVAGVLGAAVVLMVALALGPRVSG